MEVSAHTDIWAGILEEATGNTAAEDAGMFIANILAKGRSEFQSVIAVGG